MRCQHKLNWGADGVRIYRDDKAAWFEGAAPCNSIWSCPVCAAKIAARRQDELQKSIDAATEKGHGVALVTLTFSHQKSDFLALLLPKFKKALRAIKSGRRAAELRERFGVIGEVRALEVTHGAHGWHPHSHAVVFFKVPPPPGALAEYKNRLFALWAAACARALLGAPTEDHGVDIRGARHAGDYVAKWGFSSELTRAHLKRGNDKGRTPWQLLSDAADGDKMARILFREFGEIFKGARQLFWTAGLRARLDLGEVLTDQAALALPETGKELIATVDALTWDYVVEANAFEIVAAAAMQGREYLEAILHGIRWRQATAAPP